jgi:hypothetical protein
MEICDSCKELYSLRVAGICIQEVTMVDSNGGVSDRGGLCKTFGSWLYVLGVSVINELGWS